jgi:hypothetical protein
MSWKVQGYCGLRTAVGEVTGAIVFLCFCAASFGQTANDHDWPTASLNSENTRFSPLTQINADNVKDLRLAWTFGTGMNRGHEERAIIVGSTMYLVTPYPNDLYALDLAHNGMIKWRLLFYGTGDPAIGNADILPGDNKWSSHIFARKPQTGEQFNCIGCHGNGGGDIGPALMDDVWFYGSSPEQIYASLVQGRPNGMPAYGRKLSHTHVAT